ncbi:polyketide synthase [Actinomadura sp. DC4]|uniref:polyketide synthase n=1 Tax=Actinomadura sp. DC4 TaxID=3055069 RepID=UPI0025B0506C|nr:polyketide synthase [Actinomadura sp. DC4]MDN3354265.1 beta-ketoacyl synthase N-terminal-like domain-containing protein [Actinomadura sp. DC4]
MTATPVAIVGLACRVPGGDDLEQFWETLAAGRLVAQDVPESRRPGYDADVVGPGGLTAALLPDVDAFDLNFFRIGRRMAVWMDPQQRLLLETSWHAFEAAGIPPSSLRGEEVGVYVASATADFRERMMRTGTVDRYSAVGGLSTYLANRLSHQYDLRGPSMTIDTGCSSGLSAVALAVSALRAGDIDTALVGASNVVVEGWYSAAMAYMGALSPSGVCRPFSADADGYIRGEGALSFVLMRLDDALASQSPVVAVIPGVATNHDGHAGGLTKTDSQSQARLMRRALDQAGLGAGALGYLESHAPGTKADALEVEGLRVLLRSEPGGVPAGCGPDGRMWMGSVKAVVGHLEAAAGSASLVKGVLVLLNEAIPASTGLLRLGADAGLTATEVPEGEVPWPRSDEPRRLGISSFGVGGSNAHVVLEEAPSAAAPDAGEWGPAPVPVPLSAARPDALPELAARLSAFLSRTGAPALTTTAWTLQAGRDHLPHRAVVVARSREELIERLDKLAVDGLDELAPEAASVCAAWLEGEDADWAALWERTPTRRVRLPGYPFARTPLGFAPQTRPVPAARG